MSIDISKLKVIYEDDPEVVKMENTDDYSVHRVPENKRTGLMSTTSAWALFMTGAFQIIISGTLALAVGTIPTIIGIIITVITMGAIGTYLSRQTAPLGVGQNLLSRKVAFGYAGGFIASLILGLATLYYAALEASVMAHSFEVIIPGINVKIWYAIMAFALIPMVWYGMKLVEKVANVTFFIWLFGFIALLIITQMKTGGCPGWLTYMPEDPVATGPMAIIYVVTSYMALYIWFMEVPDYARFIKKKDIKKASWITFGPVFQFVANLVLGLCGIWLTLSIGAGYDSGVYIPMMMGIWGTLFVLLTQVRINVGNLYVSSLSFAGFFVALFKKHIPRNAWAIIISIVVFIVMLTNVMDWINAALKFQGVLMVSWIGVVLPYFWFARKRTGEYETIDCRRSHTVSYNRAGIIGMIAALVVGNSLLFFGGDAGATWSSLAALFAAFIATVIAGYATGFSDYQDKYAYDNSVFDEIENKEEARVQCSVCGRHYKIEDMEICPVTNAPICSLCCSENKNCHDLCKKQS